MGIKKKKVAIERNKNWPFVGIVLKKDPRHLVAMMGGDCLIML